MQRAKRESLRWEVIQLAAAGRFVGVVYAEDQEKAFAAAVVELKIDPAKSYIVRKG